MSDRIYVLDRVRVPDGRIGTLSEFSAESVRDGRATEAKVVFPDGQSGQYKVSDLIKV